MKLKSGSLGSKSARKALRRRSAIALVAGTMLVTGLGACGTTSATAVHTRTPPTTGETSSVSDTSNTSDVSDTSNTNDVSDSSDTSDVSDSSDTSDTSSTLAEWAGAHSDVLTSLTTDVSSISDAADAYDTEALSIACSALGDDIGTAQATEPLPDEAIDAHWQAALNEYADAATSCTEGADEMDATKLGDAVDSIAAGNVELSAATDLIGD